MRLCVIITSSPNGQYDGAELVWYGFFTPKTEDRTLEALITCGCTNLATLEGVTTNEVQIVVNHEPHFGKPARCSLVSSGSTSSAASP